MSPVPICEVYRSLLSPVNWSANIPEGAVFTIRDVHSIIRNKWWGYSNKKREEQKGEIREKQICHVFLILLITLEVIHTHLCNTPRTRVYAVTRLAVLAPELLVVGEPERPRPPWALVTSEPRVEMVCVWVLMPIRLNVLKRPKRVRNTHRVDAVVGDHSQTRVMCAATSGTFPRGLSVDRMVLRTASVHRYASVQVDRPAPSANGTSHFIPPLRKTRIACAFFGTGRTRTQGRPRCPVPLHLPLSHPLHHRQEHHPTRYPAWFHL